MMEQIVYHTGNLAADRLRDDTVNAKAVEAMERWRAGHVHLVQRIARTTRNAAGYAMRTFEYMEVPTRKGSNK
jgi:hypothetical protein